MKKYLGLIIILLITNISTIYYFTSQKQKQKYVVAPVVKKVAGDTVLKSIVKNVPVPYQVYTNQVPVYSYPDSSRYYDSLVKADYYKSYAYRDTIVNDSSLFIAVSDSVSCNKLVSQKVDYQNRRLTQIITNIYEPAVTQKKYSIIVGASYVDKIGMSPTLMLRTNKFYLSASYRKNCYVVGLGYQLFSF